MKSMDLKIVTWKEGRQYIAQCLNVDVSSFGKTRKEALKNLEEALELYFEDVKTTKVSKIIKPELVKLSVNYA